MTDERRDRGNISHQESEELLHVAVLGPAHVGNGVILALLLVERIVTSGAVGPGHEHAHFLAVHRLPMKAHVHSANNDDTAAIANDLYCLGARRRALRRGSDDDAVGTAAIGRRRNRLRR